MIDEIEIDEEEVVTTEARELRIEEAIFGGLVNRTEIDLAWATSTSAETLRNRRRYLVATERNKRLA